MWAKLLVAVFAISSVRAELTAESLEQHTFGPFSKAWDWDIGGSAAFTKHVLRLTPDLQSQSGYVWNTQPLATVGHEWAVEMEFRIYGQGVTLFGDGMALWLTKEKFQPGRALGHSESWTGLGIFFDTYDNNPGSSTKHTHPYVSVMLNDGTLQYYHDSDGTHALAHPTVGCSSRFRQFGQDVQTVAARLYYKDTRLSLKLLYGNEGDFKTKPAYEWQHCFEVPDIIVPPGYYVGVTASTGQLSDVHELVSLRVRGEVGGNIDQVPEDIRAGWTQQQEAATVEQQPHTPESEHGGHLNTETVEDALRKDETGHHTHVHVEAKDNAEAAPAESVVPREQASGEEHVDKNPPHVESVVPSPPAQSHQQSVTVQRSEDTVDDKVVDVRELLESTPIVQIIKQQGESNRQTLESIHNQLNDKVSNLHNHLQEMLVSLQKTEVKLSERLAALESRVNARVQRMTDESLQASNAWLTPFVVLVVGVLAVGVWAWRRYRQLEKIHLL